MTRRLLAVGLIAVAVAAIYLIAFGQEKVAPRVVPSRAVAAIGSGSDAVGVAANGAVLVWQPAPEEGSLPQLPLSEPPEQERLAGPMLEQVRVLGGAPASLRPYLADSRYGESGVDIELTTGIELRFGDATRVEEKWRAAAAVLADPSITTLDYVDLHAPRHPAIGGSSHTLPTLE